uniref:Secreted protein n=1 Tax=Ascaris lumbricoides TaxID=6252 RepID=A0A0M3ISD8_ASCLU
MLILACVVMYMLASSFSSVCIVVVSGCFDCCGADTIVGMQVCTPLLRFMHLY